MFALRALALAFLGLLPGGDDPVPTSFTVLAGFEFKPGEALPQEVTDLDAKLVRIQGFMQPEIDGETDVETFLLINDACGCDGTPKLNEIVYCVMPEGQRAKIVPGVVRVIGTLYVGEDKEDGEVIGIYYLDVTKIE